MKTMLGKALLLWGMGVMITFIAGHHDLAWSQENEKHRKPLGQTVIWEDNKATVAVFDNNFASVGELWLSHPQQSGGDRQILIMPAAGVKVSHLLIESIKKAYDLHRGEAKGDSNVAGSIPTDDFVATFSADVAQTTPVVKIEMKPKDEKKPTGTYFFDLSTARDLVTIVARVPKEVGMAKREADIQLRLQGLNDYMGFGDNF